MSAHSLRGVRRAIAVLPLALAVCALVPAFASADPVVSSLRVEGPDGRLASGESYVNDSAKIKTDQRTACGGSGDVASLKGPTALGLLQYGLRVDRDLRPLGVSDKFSFGLFVCGIGTVVDRGADGYWLYKVNHKAPEVGADQFTLKRNDEVLWYFQVPAGSPGGPANTGAELRVSAPDRAKPGEQFIVTVYAYDDKGTRTRAQGARLRSPGGVQITDANGQAEILVDQRTRAATLRATRGADIPSNPERVCVDDRSGKCQSKLGQTIYGTNSADTIRGTSGADRIISRGGNDRIDVRRGKKDTVICGSGSADFVRASRNDRVSRTCERVVRS